MPSPTASSTPSVVPISAVCLVRPFSYYVDFLTKKNETTPTELRAEHST